ncbi:MAG: ribonuclease III [Pseudomonadota bacterium]
MAEAPESAIECALDYRFSNKKLLDQALTHRSYSGQHNERLEFLGDAILSYTIADLLYSRFPQCSEGDLSRMRSNLVKGNTLTDIGTELNLGPHLKLGTGEAKSGGRRRASILADAVEALIGAVHLDSDIDTTKRLIEGFFAARLSELDPHNPGKDAKTQLQELMQSRQHPLPKYDLKKTSGKAHEQVFEVECRVKSLSAPTRGLGGSRREAEQDAAAGVLEQLQGE